MLKTLKASKIGAKVAEQGGSGRVHVMGEMASSFFEEDVGRPKGVELETEGELRMALDFKVVGAEAYEAGRSDWSAGVAALEDPLTCFSSFGEPSLSSGASGIVAQYRLRTCLRAGLRIGLGRK